MMPFLTLTEKQGLKITQNCLKKAKKWLGKWVTEMSWVWIPTRAIFFMLEKLLIFPTVFYLIRNLILICWHCKCVVNGIYQFSCNMVSLECRTLMKYLATGSLICPLALKVLLHNCPRRLFHLFHTFSSQSQAESQNRKNWKKFSVVD